MSQKFIKHSLYGQKYWDTTFFRREKCNFQTVATKKLMYLKIVFPPQLQQFWSVWNDCTHFNIQVVFPVWHFCLPHLLQCTFGSAAGSAPGATIHWRFAPYPVHLPGGGGRLPATPCSCPHWGTEGLQILFKWFNLDSYYPLPYYYYHSMYNCALSQSSHVDCQTLICVNPWQTWIRFRLIELVSMHFIMLMRLEPREVW